MMAMAGMCTRSFKKDKTPATAAGALAATRYQRVGYGPGVHPLLVITNSGAGTADEESLEAALQVLRKQTDVEVAATGDPGELDGVLHRAGSRRIVVAGGDGSLHAVISCLHKRHDLGRNVLGLLPLGTGNDFARGVGLPLDVEEAAQVLLDGTPRPMDLIVDEVGQIAVNSLHVGAGAQASRRAGRWKERLGAVGVGKVNLGRLGYPIGAAVTAWNPPLLRLRVELDGTVVNDLDRPVLQVAVGNGSSVGGGTALTPDADPGDGLLDVMVSRAVGPLARLIYAARLGFATHQERDDVHTYRARSVSISGERFWCSADGEIYGPERRRSWHIEPAAYSMVLPA
jgi:diacylglycerol kinase (ATP)